MFDCEYVETKAGSNRFKRHIQEKAPLKKKVGRPKKIESEVRNVAIPVTLNQCNAKRNEIVTKHRNGEEPPSTANRKKRVILLIDTVANNYFNEKTKIDRTLKAYYVNHVFPFFKDYDFGNITNTKIIKFTRVLQSKKSIKTGDDLSPKTINTILNVLKSIIKYAIKNDLIKNDFSKYINLLNVDNARERFLTKDEISTLFANTKDDETLFLYFKLALNTGARLSTLQNIYKKDIDFTHSLLALKDFKNNSTYKTFLNEELLGLVNKKVEQLNPNDKIFISNPERRMRQILDDLFNIGIDKNDRKNKIVFHTLRYIFASYLVINGVPIFTIQKLMNHKEIKMTLRYAKLSPDSGREALMNLGL